MDGPRPRSLATPWRRGPRIPPAAVAQQPGTGGHPAERRAPDRTATATGNPGGRGRRPQVTRKYPQMAPRAAQARWPRSAPAGPGDYGLRVWAEPAVTTGHRRAPEGFSKHSVKQRPSG